jgi:predicted Zn-dependent protease
MKYFVYLLACGGLAALVAGCNSTQRKAGEEARANWELARNKVAFQVALEDYENDKLPSCKAQLARILASKEPCVPAYVLAAKVAMKEGHYNEAQSYLDLARTAAPKSAEVWYGEGLLKELSGQTDEALADLAKAQVLDPNDPDYLICLSELYVRQGQAAKGLELLSRYELQFATHVGVQSALADLYSMKGDNVAAATCLRRILREQPGDRDARQRLALALASGGQPELAMPLLQEIIAQGNVTGNKTAFKVALAECALKLGRYLEAEEAYAKLCQAEPGNAEWNFHLAECYLAEHHDQAALGRLLKVLEINPKHAEAQALLGYVHFAQGDLKAAEGWLRAAIDRTANPTLVAVVLVRTLQAQGRSQEANEVWAEFGGAVATARAAGLGSRLATVEPKNWQLGAGK